MTPIDSAFTQFPILTTPRLCLRQLQTHDAEALFDTFSDAEVMRFHGQPVQQTLEDTHAWLTKVETRYAQRDAIRWGITLPADDRVIGTCSFHRFDEGYYRVETGYDLNRAYWRQGIMLEAMAVVLAYGFEALRLHRIEAVINIANDASHALLLKLGFTYEGVLRQRGKRGDTFEDQHFFGLLTHEWHGSTPNTAILTVPS
ncbi:MAG: GNAT family N-acetyltransferase [Armatimonadetes bacterium]|nr:GNAT family N-acetyltransferase [Anaerolineae bacterium]